MKNKQLVEKFVAGATAGKVDNMFIEGNKLFSYGRHFVLAERRGNDTFWLNKEKFSKSTTKQQTIVNDEISRHKNLTIVH